jgi:hypothetical protein
MKKLTITIETTNAAFDGMPSGECVRILRELCDTAYHQGFMGMTQAGKTKLYDVNGNVVGKFIVN